MSLRQKTPRVVLDPKAYILLKNQVLERDSWRCQECGSLENLQVHHLKFRSRLGHDEMTNLTTLCVRCHRRQHGN
jgi:5-methylcytosine-specific restriction endonuclease McrA